MSFDKSPMKGKPIQEVRMSENVLNLKKIKNHPIFVTGQ